MGCGNGKYLGVNKDLFMIGTDRSSGLIGCAKDISEDNYNLGIADGLALPHPDNTFDFAISIAVIHHFSTTQRRVDAIKHILTKLRTGGELLIYCWALEQENSRRGYKEGDDQDILIPWVLPQQQKKRTGPKKRNRKKKNITDGIADIDVNESTVNDPGTATDVLEPAAEPVPEPVTKYRYYHLYSKGELELNCLETGDCTIVDQGYEMDNWWIIVKKK